MKRIIIICEGPTEQEFCKDVLQPHFNLRGIYLHCPTIKKSAGGIVPWNTLKKQIEIHLLQDRSVFVTTLIDYYGINEKHSFPGWDTSIKIIDKNERMTFLENSMTSSVNKAINNRFISYIQLHEFEGLLFNDITIFNNIIPQGDFINKNELENTINNYPNPEMINDTPQNAPSFRLSRLIKGYNKIVYGAIIAENIGLNKIRSKSLRFHNWVSILEAL